MPVDRPGPKPSESRSRVAFESRPAFIVEVACGKPGAGASKWKRTVRSSRTSLPA